MKRVVVESPLAGDFARNQRYARLCMRDCLERCEAPFASHLLYVQCLDDRIREHRELGMRAGFEWGRLADFVAVYTDLGASEGMNRGIEQARLNGVEVVYRQLPPKLMELLDAPGVQATPGAAGAGAHSVSVTSERPRT